MGAKQQAETELGKAVAALVVAEVVRRGLSSRILKMKSSYLYAGVDIGVGSTRVPFVLSESWAGAGFSIRRSGKYRATVESLRIASVQHVDTRTFRQSKARAATHGFDIPKIAEHVILWAEVFERESKRAAQKKKLKGDWAALAKNLNAKYGFPDASDTVRVRGTSKGIEITCLVGARDAEAILKVLAPE